MAGPIVFFDSQFQRQIASHEFSLNPFEQAALPYLRGSVLDLGCGLGNLALEAGRRGCEVLAIDASPTAIEHINRQAALERLRVQAVIIDIGNYEISENYDSIVCIGLLMFFPRPQAVALLQNLQAHLGEGGCAIINVLNEDTTYLEMFQVGRFTLFGREELQEYFCGWDICLSRQDDFDAPGGTRKAFSTLIARKPAFRQQ